MDFIKNIETDQMPMGYGSYQADQEIGAELERLRLLNVDMRESNIKEQMSKINAKKIINKYNTNSNRVIESNHIERKVNILEEDLDRVQNESVKPSVHTEAAQIQRERRQVYDPDQYYTQPGQFQSAFEGLKARVASHKHEP